MVQTEENIDRTTGRNLQFNNESVPFGKLLLVQNRTVDKRDNLIRALKNKKTKRKLARKKELEDKDIEREEKLEELKSELQTTLNYELSQANEIYEKLQQQK